MMRVKSRASDDLGRTPWAFKALQSTEHSKRKTANVRLVTEPDNWAKKEKHYNTAGTV